MGSDGMTIDAEGNLYLTTYSGVTVFNAQGSQIEHILVPEIWTTNVTFGGEDRKTLFITAQDSLYGLRMRVEGASIPPDFNHDYKVDIQDLLKLIQSWGQNDPSADIAPPPFGDGVVDEKDLEVLMRYWGQEVCDPTLLAYWKLDETEGDIAYNSVSDNHCVLSGNPTWQPGSGQIAGALQFDGVDDYISTDFVLNPADGSFSVFAWIKDGAAGQAILSQEGGVNWLMADPIDGTLRTDLKEPASAGRNPKPPGPPLICSTVVTDGDWHRVGFVRDGINSILYVDDVEVARDIVANLEAAYGGMYIGAGSGLELGTFWSGLIDDVRIYNKALSAEQIDALVQ
jgi:hypothetical protein